MPKGVYPRTENQLKAAPANLAKGHEPEARAKAIAKLRENAKDPAWREKVSRATKEALRRPEVRKRYLAGMKQARKKHGINFRGGNGQSPTGAVVEMEKILAPFGFQREYVIRTKNHGTEHKTPMHYKADFANPKTKTVIELDGPVHRPGARTRMDQRKTEVLEALGWKVTRIEHQEADALSGTLWDSAKLSKLLESLMPTPP